MSRPFVSLRDARLRPEARGLDMDIWPGDAVAVLGPSASGKSLFTKVLLGHAKLAKGKLVVESVRGLVATRPSVRSTPQSLLSKRGVPPTASTKLLSVFGLWDSRNRPVAELSPAQWLACQTMALFTSEPCCIVLDGVFDQFDMWTRRSVLEGVESLRDEGWSLVVATNDEGTAHSLGDLLVLRDCEPVFIGTVAEIVKAAGPVEIRVVTDQVSEALAMVEPLALIARETPEGLRIVTHKGQAVAAMLLTQGYGSVESVLVREPSLTEALSRFL